MRILLLFIIVFNLPSYTSAQYYHSVKDDKSVMKKHLRAPEKAMDFYKKGLFLAQGGQVKSSLKQFEKAVKKTPDFIDAHIMVGECYQELKKFDDARTAYSKALDIDKDFSPKVYYSLARMSEQEENWSDVEKHMITYLSYPNLSEINIRKATKKKIDAKFRAQAYGNPVPFNPENLGEGINTPFAEYAPCLSADGQTMIYTVRVEEENSRQEDFYISKKVEGIWQKGKNLGPPINTPENEGAQSLSADGKTIVYTVCGKEGGFGSCDLYISRYSKRQWSKSKNLGSAINSELWESQPSISANGLTLYFVRGKKGGYEKQDIWYSNYKGKGRWSKAKKMSNTINTIYNDGSPFIHPDGNTLYFRSKGHAGLGNYDLFISRKTDDGKWSKPLNLGYPINTKGEEGGLIVDLKGEKAYFHTDSLGSMVQEDSLSNFGKRDIYAFDLPKKFRPGAVTYLDALVVDAKSGKPIRARVEVTELDKTSLFASDYTENDGKFLVCLPAGKDYSLHVEAKGYLFYSGNFSLKSTQTFEKPYEYTIKLQKVPEPETLKDTKPIVLNNVFFETGSAELKTTSTEELNRLKDMLEDYPKLKIQLNGHTDNVGEEPDNQKLSEDRANAVKNYLVEKGIEETRVKAKGFGETKPVADNSSSEGRAKNRRTEFEVIEN